MKQLVLLVLAALLVLPQEAPAQAFPSRPVRILCPFSPGGGVDITARAIAQGRDAQLRLLHRPVQGRAREQARGVERRQRRIGVVQDERNLGAA